MKYFRNGIEGNKREHEEPGICSRKHTAAAPASNRSHDCNAFQYEFPGPGLMLPGNFSHGLCSACCFIKNMQTSQSRDFEVINTFNPLTLGSLSTCRVNDACRSFGIWGVLITKSLATSNLGMSEASTSMGCICCSHGIVASHLSHERLSGSGLHVDLLITTNCMS